MRLQSASHVGGWFCDEPGGGLVAKRSYCCAVLGSRQRGRLSHAVEIADRQAGGIPLLDGLDGDRFRQLDQGIEIGQTRIVRNERQRVDEDQFNAHGTGAGCFVPW